MFGRKRVKVVELRPALEPARLVAGLRELKASPMILEAVLHMLQYKAVELNTAAGMPGVDPIEAKTCSRAAGEFAELYDTLLNVEPEKLVP